MTKEMSNENLLVGIALMAILSLVVILLMAVSVSGL